MPHDSGMVHHGGTGGDRNDFTQPLVCRHTGRNPKPDKGFDWPEPTPESEAFWKAARKGRHVQVDGDHGYDTTHGEEKFDAPPPAVDVDDALDDAPPAPGRRGPKPTFNHDLAMRRYAAGECASAIAADLGVKPGAISNVASRRGVKRGQNQPTTEQPRPRARSATHDANGMPVFRRDSKLAPHWEEIARRYRDGESMGSLARAFDVTAQAISMLLRKVGEPIRNPQARMQLACGKEQPEPTPPAPVEPELSQQAVQAARLLDAAAKSTDPRVRRARDAVLVTLSVLDELQAAS